MVHNENATVKEAAAEYIRRGWAPIPIPHRSKAPILDDWQNLRLTPETIGNYFNGKPQNIGGLLGDKSGGLIDIDLDHVQAVVEAENFLPATGAIFGRASKQRSHWLYRATSPIATHKRQHAETGMIVELRSTGVQTVFPPSVHPSGEPIEWHTYGEPLEIEPGELRACVDALADAVLRHLGIDPAATTKTTSTATKAAPLDVTERAARYIAKIPGAVSGQGGHGHTFHVGCVLVLGFGLTPDQAYPLLAEWNTTCQPPWSEKELQHKLADANKQGGPRGWLLDGRGYTGPDVGLRRMVSSGGQGEQAAGATAQLERPKILITAAEHEVNDAALAALASDPGIYQRGGALVHIVKDAGPDDGIDRRGVLPRIAELPEMALRERLTRCAHFRQLRKTDEGFAEVDAHPPMWCYKAILQRGAWDTMPRLVGVVPSPVLRADGSVLRRAGFDRKTGLFCAFDDPLELSEHPTQRDATAAAERLLDVVCDFPFGKPAHRAAWLACVLTPLARYAFAGPAPLFLFDANVRGSGKTLLGELVSLIDYGRDIARMANPRNDDEARKRITALALAGDPLVQIDNVVGQLGCASLDAALTGTVWKDRILGSSTIVELPLCVTWLASGNNVMLAADTSRRVLHIRLESDQERPEDRTGFKFPDVRQHVHRHRAELLASALTILSAYSQAKRPPQGLTPWGSFEGWSAVVREAVVWAGLPDPGETRQELVETADREAGALRELLETWGQIDPNGYGMTAAEIADRLRAPADGWREFRAALLELCPAKGDLPNGRQIGNQFAHVRRRVIGGKALDFREGRGRRRAWFVVQTGACGDSGDTGDTV